MPTNTEALAKKIQRLSAAYYNGTPQVSDDAWDALVRKLKAAAPDHPVLRSVGAPPKENTLRKIKHQCFLGSIDNAFDEKALESWAVGIRDHVGKNVNVVASLKLDGLSVQLSYRKGKFVHAALRGDGKEGEDVSANVQRARGFVSTLNSECDADVRCEAILSRSAWKKYFKPEGAKNARTSASGTLRRKDGAGSDFLDLIAFDVEILRGESPKMYDKMLDMLTDNGFKVVPWVKIPCTSSTIIAEWNRILQDRDNLKYDIDGVIFRVNPQKYNSSLGWSDTCPRYCIAGKWRGQMVAETTAVGIFNSVGRTGVITPVLAVEPVTCGGVTIRDVSLMNWHEVERLESVSGFRIGNGCRVKIERAGDVIPTVWSLLSDNNGTVYDRPEKCPSCGADTVEDGPRQRCISASCPAQTVRTVMHWIKQRNIMHIGPETVDKLMAMDGPVVDVADLYTLTQKQVMKACGGSIMAEKIMKAIDASRTCTLADVLGSIGIKLIGITEARKLCASCGITTLKEARLLDVEQAKAAIGPTKGTCFVEGIRKLKMLTKKLNKVLEIKSPSSSDSQSEWSGKTFCITGNLSIPRNEFIKMLEDAGAYFKSSVVNGLDYLITEKPDSNTTKIQDAKKKGIHVIGEAAALKMLGDP